MATTWKQHEKSLSEPGLCQLLPIRDYLDDVMIRLSGEFVAGYVLKGAVSYFADDAGLNTIKLHLEAILRTIPEESMRLQFRFEVTEDLGDLLQRYQDCSRTQDEATLAMDQNRLAMWQRKEAGGGPRSSTHERSRPVSGDQAGACSPEARSAPVAAVSVLGALRHPARAMLD